MSLVFWFLVFFFFKLNASLPATFLFCPTVFASSWSQWKSSIGYSLQTSFCMASCGGGPLILTVGERNSHCPLNKKKNQKTMSLRPSCSLTVGILVRWPHLCAKCSGHVFLLFCRTAVSGLFEHLLLLLDRAPRCRP